MRRLGIPALLAVLALAASGTAAAMPADDARAAFQQGVKLFEQKQFSAAADAFEQAYSLKPSYKLLFNIGQARAAARQYDLALVSFERYLVDGGDEIDDDRRTEVLGELAKIRPLVGYIEVEAPAGLEVRVDGAERGETPLPGKLLVTVGIPHRVDLLENGSLLLTQEIRVSGGMAETLRFSMPGKGPEPEPEPAGGNGEGGEPVEGPEPEPLPEDGSGSTGLEVWGWVTLGAGAGGGGGGGGWGGVGGGGAGRCPSPASSRRRARTGAALRRGAGRWTRWDRWP
jgi:hypothetical protein